MLDLKLAVFLPFLEAMQPGVFITASDDIEVFNIDKIPAETGTGIYMYVKGTCSRTFTADFSDCTVNLCYNYPVTIYRRIK
jgi:hypothetical protein